MSRRVASCRQRARPRDHRRRQRVRPRGSGHSSTTQHDTGFPAGRGRERTSSSAKGTTSASISPRVTSSCSSTTTPSSNPGWIEELAATMQDDPAVAAVGPMFLYPDGTRPRGRQPRARDRRCRAGGQGQRLGSRALRHSVRRRLLLGRLPAHASVRLPRRRRVRLRMGTGLLRGRRSLPEALDHVREGGREPAGAGGAHREQDDIGQTAPLGRHFGDQSGSIRRKWGPWLEARQTGHLARRQLAARPDRAPREHARRQRQSTHPSSSCSLPTRSYPAAVSGSCSSWRRTSVHWWVRHHVTFSTPSRYSSIRMRRSRPRSGLGRGGHRTPLGSGRPESVRFSVVLGNSIDSAGSAIRPTQRLSTAISVLHVRRGRPERRTASADYDEIWVYSDFVRRNVNGLLRHYWALANPDQGHPATGDVGWGERRRRGRSVGQS